MRKLTVSVLLVLLLALAAAPLGAQDAADCETFQGSPEAAAPDFPLDLDWVNASAPLTLDDLRGKIVLLDFWTYGCINCLHMILVLDQLERAYEEELVIIGVHSAKFDNEGQTANIREIVQRYEIEHAVINDAEFDVWNNYRRYGVNAWPTFVLIDPRGNIFAVQSGEIPFEAFDTVIGTMADCFAERDEINTARLPQIDPELAYAPPRSLNYPGKVLADADGGRLFIADSVNHRIIVADLHTYEVLDVIGNGAQGYTDGAYNEAQFYKPQGMAVTGDTLYISDTFNHVIRAVDLNERTVDTVAGTGVRGRTVPRGAAFDALTTDLRSPWDVTFGDDPDTLYIAMAGTHQIWVMDLETGQIGPFVGNGREAQLNLSLANSELAQPSGLYYEDGLLFFADSESSTIRVADIAEDQLAVVSGTTENSLFTYGDADGAPGESLLQHALGVAGDGDGTLYVVDTYNDKIKIVTLDGYVTETISGDAPGYVDGPLAEARFNEPGGLSYANGMLYIADTNNHTIRVLDVAAGAVTTVVFPNPEALQIEGQATVVAGNPFSGAQTLDAQAVAAGDGEIVFEALLPEGYKINNLAPSVAEFAADGEAVLLDDTRYTIEDTTLTVPVTFEDGETTLRASFDVYYCEAINEALCFVEQFAVEIPVTVGDGEANAVTIQREIVPPSLQ